ncbi:uncharacterized protein LOC134100063 [Sardina pilchardus]|uniref:uncharacterized protein LOC134100063 n=1 Tax=Sardina pilchardus TaxID=27697 RepID=UPI002E1580C0
MHSAARPKLRPCPNACGHSIERKDTHTACVFCLGLQHAREALDNPQGCAACSRFGLRTLQHRFDDFGLNLPTQGSSDPLLSELVMSEEDEAQLLDWSGSQGASSMARPSPMPLPALEALEYSSEEDVAMEECVDGELLFPPSQPAPASTAASVLGEPATAESHTSGQAVPGHDCLDDVAKTWGKPFSNRVVIGGFGSLTEMEGAAERGLLDCPRAEQSLASYLAPDTNMGLTASSQLPHKQPKFTSQLLEKNYKALGQAARAQNTVSLLLAYVAELQAEVGAALEEGKPVKDLWTEIRTAMDFVMRSTRCSNQAVGRAMGLTVVAQRHLWLNLSKVPDKDRHAFLDAPVDPSGLFGSAVQAMQTRCESKKKENEAFSYLLPRRLAPSTSTSAAAQRSHSPQPAKPARQWPSKRFQSTTPRQPQPQPQPSPAVVQGAWARRPTIQLDANTGRPPRRGPMAKKKRPACPWVLSTMEQGYRIQFARRPPGFRGLLQSVPNAQSKQILREEIESLLKQNAVRIVPQNEAHSGFYSRYFVVPKRDGGSRPILDLRALNSYIRTYKFKMLTHRQLLASMRQGDWFTKLDLKRAYFHIGIYGPHRQFLRFYFEGRALEFQTIPFGIATAPRAFSRVMQFVTAPLRERGLRIYGYIDDYLLCAQSARQAKEHTELFLRHLESLGFLINYQKSILIPTQTINFLGLTLNSVPFRATVTSQRAVSFRNCLSAFQLGRRVKFRACLRLLGLMASMIAVVPLGQLFMRDMQRWVFSLGLCAERGAHMNKMISVSTSCMHALRMWRDPSLLSRGASMGLIAVRKVLTTDASLTGWGATLENWAVGGSWSALQSQLHINVLELLAVFLSLKHFLPILSRQHVLIRTDNTAVVSYINRQGGLRSLRLHRLAYAVLTWSNAHLKSLRATHVPGRLNIRADRLSRASLSNQEWRVHPSVIEHIWARFGRAEIDLFASKENTHCELFFSILDWDAPLGTDALAHTWPNVLLYAFPPVHLVPNVLARVRDGGLTLILVAPWWTNRPWLAEIFQLLVGVPWRLPNHTDLLSQMGGELLHPNPCIWNLYAFLVSGKR